MQVSHANVLGLRQVVTMPRIGHPRLAKAEAITCLLNLYWNEPAFVKELQSLRQPYAQVITKLAANQVNFLLDCKKALPPDKYQKTLDIMRGGEFPELPANLAQRLEEIQQQWLELQPYLDGLGALAWKWKLRAKWSAFMLAWYDICHVIFSTFQMPKEVEVPLDIFDDFYPWAPPLPPLEIKVSSWAFIHFSRQQMIEEIAKELQEYEQKIKNSGLRERPSAIARHCQWWFEHYVKGKTYVELEKDDPSVVQESIKRAVWNFSRRVGLRMGK